jgi:hypothetical protein
MQCQSIQGYKLCRLEFDLNVFRHKLYLPPVK